MQSDDDLRSHLRRHLGTAVRDRDRIPQWLPCGRRLLRWTMPKRFRPTGTSGLKPEYVAGGVVGLGAAEVERRILDAGEQRTIVRAVIEMRLAAASTYDEHGQSARAGDLRWGVEIVIAILG